MNVCNKKKKKNPGSRYYQVQFQAACLTSNSDMVLIQEPEG